VLGAVLLAGIMLVGTAPWCALDDQRRRFLVLLVTAGASGHLRGALLPDHRSIGGATL
jgi:hypothetical protein